MSAKAPGRQSKEEEGQGRNCRDQRQQKCRGTERVHRPGGRGVLRCYARSGKQNGKPELPIDRIAQRGESRGFIEMNIHKRC